MASVEQIIAAHYRLQQAISRQAAQQAQELWGQVDSRGVLDSWLAVLDDVIRVLTGGQLAAAGQAQPYLDALAAAQGLPPAPLVVDPAALAGVAADGRPLASLLKQPALRTLGLLARGADDQDALRAGLASLVRIVDTEISDASRTADQVGITARREWVMYVRHVTLPACGRCIILAGRTYSWSMGFARHEQCDCTMVPYREGDTPPPTPQELFDQMSEQEQARAFTVGGAEAIRLGADLGQVVNARRGIRTVMGGRKVTTEGTTVRGIAGKQMRDFNAGRLAGERYRRSKKIRPMPEQILADAGDNREEAIRLLRQYGYILRAEPDRQPKQDRPQVVIPAPRPEPDPIPEPAPQKLTKAASRYHRSLDGIADLAAAVEAGQPPAETKRLGGASAQTELVTLKGGAKVIRKRARTGTAELQDADAEHLTSLVAKALGLAAPAVYRRSAGEVWMEYVADGQTAEDASPWGGDLDPRFQAAVRSDQGMLVGLVDALTQNADRNAGNWMLRPDGTLVPIDHGLAYGETITPGWDATLEYVNSEFSEPYTRGGGNPLTPGDVDEVRTRLQQLRPDFAHLGREEWLEYSLRVLDLLAQDAAGDRPLVAGVR
ncbi:hypothetical protein ACIBG7_15170 [Nonomuraea sp. NPDC050328]|uniref:VG15 protein n=1 Tax=Nonomuraea sp. NPDC050328 TaxID=3364361 RepID=UPI0037B250CA